MARLRDYQIDILINLVDQGIINYKDILERTGRNTWQDKIDELTDIRIKLYNDLIISWYMKGFNDELRGSSSLVSDDEILNKAYSIGADDAVIGDDIPFSDYKSEDMIIRQIIGNGTNS